MSMTLTRGWCLCTVRVTLRAVVCCERSAAEVSGSRGEGPDVQSAAEAGEGESDAAEECGGAEERRTAPPGERPAETQPAGQTLLHTGLRRYF